jgi:curved DNA-binding protein CbpA
MTGKPAMKRFDPYAELDVARDATAPEIKRAHRARAKKTHPDKGGTADAFAATTRALTILLDPARRERFDRTGDAEEDKPDNTRATALQIIEAFLADEMNKFVTAGMQAIHDPRRRNLAEAFKSKMKREVVEIENGFVQAKKVRAFFEDMSTRFETKAPTNPIKRGIENRMREVDAQVANMRDALASRQLALEIMEAYHFRAAVRLRLVRHLLPGDDLGGRGAVSSAQMRTQGAGRQMTLPPPSVESAIEYILRERDLWWISRFAMIVWAPCACPWPKPWRCRR